MLYNAHCTLEVWYSRNRADMRDMNERTHQASQTQLQILTHHYSKMYKIFRQYKKTCILF